MSWAWTHFSMFWHCLSTSGLLSIMWSFSVPASSCNVSVLSGICLAMAVHAEGRLHRAEHCEVSLQPLCREAPATSSGHSGARLSGNLGGCVRERLLGCLRSDSPEAEPEMRVTRKGIYWACTPKRTVWEDGGSRGGKGKQAGKVWTQGKSQPQPHPVGSSGV